MNYNTIGSTVAILEMARGKYLKPSSNTNRTFYTKKNKVYFEQFKGHRIIKLRSRRSTSDLLCDDWQYANLVQ